MTTDETRELEDGIPSLEAMALKGLIADFAFRFGIYEGRVMVAVRHRPSGSTATVLDVTDYLMDEALNPAGIERYLAMLQPPKVLS